MHIDQRHPCDGALETSVYCDGADYTAPPKDTKGIVADSLYLNADRADPWKVDLRVSLKSVLIYSGIALPVNDMNAPEKVLWVGTKSDRGAYQDVKRVR